MFLLIELKRKIRDFEETFETEQGHKVRFYTVKVQQTLYSIERNIAGNMIAACHDQAY